MPTVACAGTPFQMHDLYILDLLLDIPRNISYGVNFHVIRNIHITFFTQPNHQLRKIQ